MQRLGFSGAFFSIEGSPWQRMGVKPRPMGTVGGCPGFVRAELALFRDDF